MLTRLKLIRITPYVFIGMVLLVNIQAGILFFIQPENYASAYELTGIPGNAAVAGTGLLFLMWNVPYLFALSNPYKQKISLIQSIIMQTMGVVGESIILTQIPPEQHLTLQRNIWRFILFDGTGLIFLILAFFLTSRKK